MLFTSEYFRFDGELRELCDKIIDEYWGVDVQTLQTPQQDDLNMKMRRIVTLIVTALAKNRLSVLFHDCDIHMTC